MARLDWVVIAAYFAGLLGLAWWVFRKNKDTAADYFLASPEWRKTNAAKHKRVFVIKSELMSRAGPRLAEGTTTLPTGAAIEFYEVSKMFGTDYHY